MEDGGNDHEFLVACKLALMLCPVAMVERVRDLLQAVRMWLLADEVFVCIAHVGISISSSHEDGADLFCFEGPQARRAKKKETP